MNTIPVWFLRDNFIGEEAEKEEPAQQEEKAEAKKQETEPVVIQWNTLIGLMGG